MMDGALEPQEALLGCQRSWTSYFFGPGTASVVYFLLEGLSCPPQEPLGVSFSLAQNWGLRLVGLLGGRHLVPPLHELSQT